MTAADQPALDITARQNQLRDLQANLNILQEHEAKYSDNAPLELVNQPDQI